MCVLATQRLFFAKVADVLSAQADTKFEFGLDEETDEIYLVDEVLTCVPPVYPMLAR